MKISEPVCQLRVMFRDCGLKKNLIKYTAVRLSLKYGIEINQNDTCKYYVYG
jgi:hypothetical protein